RSRPQEMKFWAIAESSSPAPTDRAFVRQPPVPSERLRSTVSASASSCERKRRLRSSRDCCATLSFAIRWATATVASLVFARGIVATSGIEDTMLAAVNSSLTSTTPGTVVLEAAADRLLDASVVPAYLGHGRAPTDREEGVP